MANDAFGRVYSLRIGNPKAVKAVSEKRLARKLKKPANEFGADFVPLTINSGADRGYIEITDLQIRAYLPQAKTATSGTNNQTVIEIYNLDEVSRNRIAAFNLVFFEAGYEQDEDLPYVFAGEVKDVVTVKKGSDIITTLFCGTNQRAGRAIKITRSYNPGTTYAAILSDLLAYASANGLNTRGNLPDTVNPLVAPDLNETITFTGLTVDGDIRVVINKVVAKCNCVAYEINNVLYVEPKDSPQVYQKFILTPESIKGSIEFAERGKTKNGSLDTTSKQIKFKLFLNGEITANKRMVIPAGATFNKEFVGEYEVKSVAHYLNYEGADWHTEVIADRIK